MIQYRITDSTWNMPLSNEVEALEILLNVRTESNMSIRAKSVRVFLDALGLVVKQENNVLSIYGSKETYWGFSGVRGETEIFLSAISKLCSGYIVWSNDIGPLCRSVYDGDVVTYEEPTTVWSKI